MLGKTGKKLFEKHLSSRPALRNICRPTNEDSTLSGRRPRMIHSPVRTAPSALSKRRPIPQIRPETRILPRQGVFRLRDAFRVGVHQASYHPLETLRA